MKQNVNAMALAEIRQPFGNVVAYPGRAMTDQSLTRPKTVLNIWQMATALQIDLVAAIKTGMLSRDKPLDLLQSMARRCGACDHTEECTQLLRAASHLITSPPEFCRVKNRLAFLVNQQRFG